MANFFKKFGPSLLAVGGILLSSFSGDIQHYISAHPAIASGLALAYSVLAHIIPSPLAPQQPKP